jgi:hypothetical protein
VVFTGLFVDALGGAAANLVGAVTPGSVYAHIDQSLGSWQQRPVFKTNVKSFVSLRTVQAPIPLADLQRITEFFPAPGFEFQLDPSYEPQRGPGDDPTFRHRSQSIRGYSRSCRSTIVSPRCPGQRPAHVARGDGEQDL